MFAFIRDTVRPPGLHFKRLLSLYRMIGRIFSIVRDDIEHVHRSFFPFLASAGKGELKAHARALDIPEFPFDPAGAFRDRVAQGGAYLEERGYRGSITDAVARLFPGRYKIVEFPREAFRVGFSGVGQAAIGARGAVHLFIRGMTAADKQNAYAYLDSQLDPDIVISVKEWGLSPA